VERIVAADIGGTHARFAVAEIAGRQVRALGDVCTLRTAEHAGLEAAWAVFRERCGGAVPRSAAVAFAGPVGGDILKLTNSPWSLQARRVKQALGLERLTLVNDMAAVAHAVAQLGDAHYRHICGPAGALLSQAGVISVVGPGTGLGVAQLLRIDGRHHVIESEGGHIAFAPLDAFEDAVAIDLRERFGRVSAERIAAGAGLAILHCALAAADGRPVEQRDDKTLWEAALAGSDELAAAALSRYCLSLGAIAGDLALAHGASAVVIAGGLGLRLAGHLPGSGFAERFTAKGRFEPLMAAIPVKLLVHPQPGLYGAAAAFALEHG
jgi:glucokinase